MSRASSFVESGESRGCSQYSEEFRRMISEDIEEDEVRFRYQQGSNPTPIMKTSDDE